MRPIIGVNGDCLWLCGDVCHSPPSLSAPRSHGKLRSMLTGTGVGSNSRFVSDLELKPASKPSRREVLGRVGLLSCGYVHYVWCVHHGVHGCVMS